MRSTLVVVSTIVAGAALAPAIAAGAEPTLAERLEEQSASLNAQELRIKELERKLKTLAAGSPSAAAGGAKKTEASVAASAAASAASPSAPSFFDPKEPRKGLVISGYVQGEYQSHQDSASQLKPGGGLYNQDRFLVRRGRLKIEREFEWSSFLLEVDGNTANGPAFNLWHAEASVLYRGNNASSLPPMVRLTMGVFDTPFGSELLESPRERWFTERSWGSRQLFPAEPDVGARLTFALDWLRVTAAVLNGEPYGTPFQFRSPKIVKDIAFRAGAVSSPTPSTDLELGLSVLDGHGFSPGSDATKAGVVWRDSNENGVIDSGELTGVPPSTALPSYEFHRWSVGGDVRLRWRNPLGALQLFGELVIASNMDRGYYAADPTRNNGIDYRELSYALLIQQEILGWGLVGFRTDYYNPNADFADTANGRRIPLTLDVRTYSPLVGFTVPQGHVKVVFQYDISRNHFALNALGVPSNLAANAWTLRIQGEL